MMKNLIIIGAGGMGRVIFDTAKESLGYNTEFVIKGFIDDNVAALDNFKEYPQIIDRIDSYIPQIDDVFICSMGGASRRLVMEKIIERGGEFINLIHNTVRVGTGVVLGVGNFIGPYTTLAANCKIGNYNFLQQFVIIGHDCNIGDWNRLDSHTMCVGGILIEDETTIHTAAVLNHNVVIKNRAKVAACSFVINNVDEETVVFGNPARRMR